MLNSEELYKDFKHLDIKNVCRICFTSKVDVSSVLEDRFVNVLMKCCSLEITEEDGLYLVCTSCTSEIKHWHIFSQKVINSQEIGKWLIKRKLLSDQESEHRGGQNIEAIDIKIEDTCIETDRTQTEQQNIMIVASDSCKLECDENKKQVDETQCAVLKKMETVDDHVKKSLYNFKNYVCGLCGQKFYKMSTVTEHMQQHNGGKPFRCEHCSRTFTKALHLRMHNKNVHSTNKKARCPNCSKTFAFAFQLKVHMRIHTDEKPFPCTQCDQTFKTKSTLKTHTKCKHTLERNFVCMVCRKTFNAKYTLAEHMRIHTGERKVPQHACESCGRMFITRGLLNRHIKFVHSGERPFSCKTCDKKFVTRTRMIAHMKTHTGEKEFVCSTCGKTFSAMSSLTTHERIHSGEMPFQCSHCGRTFRQNSTLKTHMKVHRKKL